MNILRLFHGCPERTPGRHSAEWAAMRRDLTAAQSQCSTLETARDTAAQRHETEMHQQAAAFRLERNGLRESLRLAADANAELLRERNEARGRHDEVLSRLRTAEAQVEQLRATLRALEVPVDPDAAPGQPALMDDPDAWINQPDGPPRADEWISPVAPVAPVDSEAADVNAKTQLTDVRDLREDSTVTQQVALPAAWTAAALPVQPPLPDFAPTLTMPLAEAPLATEVSRDAADAARASVADAIEPDLAAALLP